MYVGNKLYIYIYISTLLSKGYTGFFKLYTDFTRWQDNAISCMCRSIDQRKPHKDQANY